MLKINSQPNIKEYNNFVADNSRPSSFQQSWQWGDFQERLGNKVKRFTLENDNQIVASGQIVVKKLFMNFNYLDLNRGPIINPNLEKTTKKIAIKKIINYLKESSDEKTVFIRFDSPFDDLLDSIHDLNLKVTSPKILTKQIDPCDTVLVNLTKSEAELFSNIHEKTRYNIKQSIKNLVKITEASGDPQSLHKFLNLVHQTSQRHQIKFWPDSRYKIFANQFIRGEELFESSNQPIARLFLAQRDGIDVLAGAIIMFFGNSATYLYAASSSKNRDLQAPSLLLWELIKFAKKDGRQWFDMWGIKPTNANDDHSWTGITRFKSRFVSPDITGQIIHFNSAIDYLYKPWIYHILAVNRFFRSIFKKLSHN